MANTLFDFSEKLEPSPLNLYVLRLLWVMNDGLSVVHLDGYVSTDQDLTKEHKTALYLYLIRLKESHICEAYKAFVDKIETPVLEFVKQHPAVSARFKHLKLLKIEEKFRSLVVSRNSIGFHYNHDVGNKITRTGLEIIREDASKESLPINLNQDELSFRSLIADRIMFHSWSAIMSKDHGDGRTVDQKKYFDYLTEVWKAWFDYSTELEAAWLQSLRVNK